MNILASIAGLYLYCRWRSCYQEERWSLIKRFNLSTCLCLSQARTWISIGICRLFFFYIIISLIFLFIIDRKLFQMYCFHIFQIWKEHFDCIFALNKCNSVMCKILLGNYTNKCTSCKYKQLRYNQSVPKTTSPMPQSSKNWFGLVKVAYNLLNQIEKILLKCCSG